MHPDLQQRVTLHMISAVVSVIAAPPTSCSVLPYTCTNHRNTDTFPGCACPSFQLPPLLLWWHDSLHPSLSLPDRPYRCCCTPQVLRKPHDAKGGRQLLCWHRARSGDELHQFVTEPATTGEVHHVRCCCSVLFTFFFFSNEGVDSRPTHDTCKRNVPGKHLSSC